jgi:hypothetical protein
VLGRASIQEAEIRVATLEKTIPGKLTPGQQEQLIQLLRKVYL